MGTRCFAVVAALLMVPIRTDAQAPATTFSVQSDLVVLHVTVRDRRGAYVTDLQRDAFEVFDEGQRRPIQLLADTAGGASFQPDDLREVDTALREIARDIRHTYTIGYVPTQVDRDGFFHRVRVEVESPNGRPLRVRSRSGYVAGLAR